MSTCSGLGKVPDRACSTLPRLTFSITSPARTKNSHGWEFTADGARPEICKTSLRISLGTGSGLKPLTLFRVTSASRTSISLLLSVT